MSYILYTGWSQYERERGTEMKRTGKKGRGGGRERERERGGGEGVYMHLHAHYTHQLYNILYRQAHGEYKPHTEYLKAISGCLIN